MPELRLRRIEPEPTGNIITDLGQFLSGLIIEEYEVEYWDLPELPDEEKEKFLQDPNGYMREYLIACGLPLPINGVAIEGKALECVQPSDPDLSPQRPRIKH